MKENKDIIPDILVEIDHKGGETVPDGYFESFASIMEAALPVTEWEKGNGSSADNRTVWQKIRPYVYMAAMFLGIWCMMNLFDLIRAGSNESLQDNPVLLAAIDNDSFFDDYVVDDISSSDLYEDLYESGFDPGQIDLVSYSSEK